MARSSFFGTAPLAIPPALSSAFRPHPAMAFASSGEIDRSQAEAYVAAFFKPGFAV